jgi:hypothetical protein
MKINLMINRQKKDNEIWETFSVYPTISYCFDTKRSIYFTLWELRNKKAIHKLGYKLKEIKELNKNIIYIYEYTNIKEIPKLSENITIDYMPVTGKKKCNKCRFLKNNFCLMKGIKINKKSYYKCFYWTEK